MPGSSDDVELGVFINGGSDVNVTGNHFKNTDHMMYMGGDSCYNPMDLAFDAVKNVTSFVAWQQAGFGDLMSIGEYSTAAAWGQKEACHSTRNRISDNTFCNLTDTQNVTWAGAQHPTALCVNCECGLAQCYGSWANNRQQCP